MGVIEKITDKGQTAHLIASTAYGTCDTAAATVDKVATIQDNHSFTLETGVTVHIKFAESNSAPQATLNVNNTGAKLIKRNGDLVIGTSVQGSWMDNSIVALTYDGEYWYLNNTNDVAVASSYYAHAENNGQAIGNGSHAEGEGTRAEGYYSHAEGRKTTASHKSQHVFGEYNTLDDSTATASNRGNYVEIVGNGTGTYARSNARTLDWDGNEVLTGSCTANNGFIGNTDKLLWTNSDPYNTSGYSDTTDIELTLSDTYLNAGYGRIRIDFIPIYVVNYYIPVYIDLPPVEKSFTVQAFGAYVLFIGRHLKVNRTATNTLKVTFSMGFKIASYATATKTQDDRYMVPYKIFLTN